MVCRAKRLANIESQRNFLKIEYSQQLKTLQGGSQK